MKKAIVVIIFALLLAATSIAASCENDDTPRRSTPVTRQDYTYREEYTPSRSMNKDAAERLCALEYGVPKWWKPDRDYHNCVDRLT